MHIFDSVEPFHIHLSTAFFNSFQMNGFDCMIPCYLGLLYSRSCCYSSDNYC